MQTAELEWLLDASSSDATGFYESIGVSFTRSGGEEAPTRCFANPTAHRNDDRKASCSVNVLTGLWHCKGCGMSGNAYQAALAVGRSEAQARDLAKRYGLFLELAKRPKERLPSWPQIVKQRHALRGSKMLMDRLLVLKGWNEYGIRRCGVGWDGERLVFTVTAPRPDSKGNLEKIGLVRYLPGGNPKSLGVGKRGLWPRPEKMDRKRPLFLVEGEPAAVSVWSCGHQAVAVPGAGSWRTDWFKRLLGFHVVFLGDCDQPGRELAARIKRDVPGVKIVDLAPERSDGFDVGDLLVEALEFPNAHAQMHGLLGGLL